MKRTRIWREEDGKRCEVGIGLYLPVKTLWVGGFFQMSVLASAAKVKGVCILANG